MSRFENDIRESLRRREPPVGFADRVIARARATDQRKPWWNVNWNWVAAAAAIVLMLSAVPVYREHRRQVEGEKAKNELMAGLRLTGSKLRILQARLSQSEQHTIKLPVEQ